MVTSHFSTGRYIYWQGTVSQICAFSATGEVWLEHVFTRRTYIVDLATLQEALARSALLIGVAIESEAAETDQLHRGIHSPGNLDRSSEDVVITYLPMLNVESSFTTSQSLAKKRRFIRKGQRRPDSVSKQGVKPVRPSTVFQHRTKKSHPQKNFIPRKRLPLSQMRDQKPIALTKSTEQHKPAVLQRALQGPRSLTIRWLNCHRSDFPDLATSATSPLPTHPRSLAAQNWEGDHRFP